mmetsp:Transcript_5339/g.8274  ORF Transcript_5339/g.8274 Transcript_5339/m.8274 type:complete len:95 (+) Transcript_5339:120-404(+)
MHLPETTCLPACLPTYSIATPAACTSASGSLDDTTSSSSGPNMIGCTTFFEASYTPKKIAPPKPIMSILGTTPLNKAFAPSSREIVRSASHTPL